MFAVGHLNADATYNWIWILIGVFTIAGLAVAGLRWMNKRAVRESKIDQVLKQLSPNGGKSIADGVHRIEKNQNELKEQLDTHIGHSDATETEIFSRLKALESKPRAPRRKPRTEVEAS